MIVGIVLVERAFHLPREDKLDKFSLRSAPIGQEVTRIDDASITARDGVRLAGWYVTPVHDNGSAVILLHLAGYDPVWCGKASPCPAPARLSCAHADSRGQGHSEGQLTTFGVEESDDVQRWVSWLQEYDTPRCTYGYGQSMGALILLRSLAVEKRFCAVVADSCPISFVEAGYDLMGRVARLGSWFGRSVGRGAMEIAIHYSRFRYKVDLADARAETGLRRSAVPALLVQGTADQKVLPRHVGRLSSCTRSAEIMVRSRSRAQCGYRCRQFRVRSQTCELVHRTRSGSGRRACGLATRLRHEIALAERWALLRNGLRCK